MLLEPRFGSRMWSGIWPPSKPLIDTPERALAPFWPRPAVLPRPEPIPRPTRTRLWRAPLLSLISLSFMVLHSLSLLSRTPRLGQCQGSGGLVDPHQMLHLLDLATHFQIGRASCREREQRSRGASRLHDKSRCCRSDRRST